MINDVTDASENFISSWASGIISELKTIRSEIDAADGVATFVGLYKGDRRVKAKQIQTKFGFACLLDDDEIDLIAARGKKFLPTGKNSRVNKELGLREASETAPAYAFIAGSGKGLSGQAWVQVARAGDEWGQDSKRSFEK
ncbi:MAG: hypothetical protein VW683_02715 [Betaproteobacteria bacterium]